MNGILEGRIIALWSKGDSQHPQNRAFHDIYLPLCWGNSPYLTMRVYRLSSMHLSDIIIETFLPESASACRSKRASTTG